MSSAFAPPAHAPADRARADATLKRGHAQPAGPTLRRQRRLSELPVLRRCACGGITGASGECQACKAKRLARESGTDTAPASEAPPIVYDVLRQPGAPLEPGVRAYMVPRVGASLAGTRIHTDSRAQRSAAAVDAHAYAVGRDVVFGALTVSRA